MKKHNSEGIVFTLDYWKDGKWVVGKLREVPGVFSQGRSLEDLVENIQEVYSLMVREGNDDLPKEKFKTAEVRLAL
jgi:predicted RNase H-like HicB family nuclease